MDVIFILIGFSIIEIMVLIILYLKLENKIPKFILLSKKGDNITDVKKTDHKEDENIVKESISKTKESKENLISQEEISTKDFSYDYLEETSGIPLYKEIQDIPIVTKKTQKYESIEDKPEMFNSSQDDEENDDTEDDNQDDTDDDDFDVDYKENKDDSDDDEKYLI
ncbi:hypothetical protein COU57_02715 [Candidatus Pacearchaeota archaeon CG10_big_fil_rev_8_21_14_0_10_32_14]|nr:MAG: hypothetical protein COU57_02715 [Candidatus Pacearchaeota archaeon CG10_big_fil_rev_8_21_14_0_10_32_14]